MYIYIYIYTYVHIHRERDILYSSRQGRQRRQGPVDCARQARSVARQARDHEDVRGVEQCRGAWIVYVRMSLESGACGCKPHVLPRMLSWPLQLATQQLLLLSIGGHA